MGIRAALELGLHVVVTDKSPNSPGRQIATQFECLDATDVDGFSRLADQLNKKFHVVGIYALEDYAAETAAVVAKRLNLPFPSRKAIRNSVFKHLSSMQWQQASVPVPKTLVIKGNGSIEAEIERITHSLSPGHWLLPKK